ncbi:MAG: DUF3795 domain-containing protein [Fidelibacterota bacterium]|nr:MAG: DUF3795 domain-containing protein [Candidatus Neomarinimicrobiota bacterium]
MTTRLNRSDFLKQSLTACTGIALGGINLSCCAKVFKRKALAEMVRDDSALEAFAALGYCSYNCEQKCKVFAATMQNDMAAKVELAKRWSERNKREILPEQVFCYGCRDTTEVPGSFKEDCTVRQCAQDKRVTTCAHCSDFAECDKELWTEWPGIRAQVQAIRDTLVD